MRKIFFTLTLITIPILSIFASGEKETNLGGLSKCPPKNQTPLGTTKFVTEQG
jgi:hypothetical protein